MHIVDVAEFYAPHGGGVKTYIDQKFAAAREMGHTLTVIAPGPKTQMEARAHGIIWWVKAWQLPVDKRYYLFTHARDVHAILDRENPDFVEASSTWRGAWIAAQWPSTAPRALVFHQDPVSVYPQTFLQGLLSQDRIDRAFGWFWRYMKNLQAGFDTSVVSSAWLAARLSSFGLKTPEIVPFGIEKADFSHKRRNESLRTDILKAMHLDPAASRLFINVSRHHPEKRIPILIQAIDRVQNDQPVGLFQVGAGPFTRKLKRLAGGRPYILFQGFEGDRTKLAELLASADAMIHGSGAETFGLVLAEALCSGLPLVAPDAGGAYDMVRPGHGEVYRLGDANAAAHAIRRLNERDGTTLRTAAIEAGCNQVRNHHEHFADLFAHYARVAASAPGSASFRPRRAA